MASRLQTPWLDDDIAAYIYARCEQPDAVQRDLIAETTAATGDRARMQISADQGALMGLLARLIGARRAIEVGTFTGYSALCLARALGPDGSLICCDVSEEWTAIGRRAWARAGVDSIIDLRIAPAIETLRSLPAAADVDLAFIDADKSMYSAYYEELLPRMRRGGLILVDNTLWSGAVVRESEPDGDTAALKAFNDMIAADHRVESYILPVSDGLTLVRKHLD